MKESAPDLGWPALTSATSTCTGADLPDALFTVVAHRLEDVVRSGSRSDLLRLNAQLEGALDQLRANSPEAVVTAIDEGSTNELATTAQAFGELGFAQRLCAYAASRRVEDAFFDILADASAQRYVTALMTRELSVTELASQLKLSLAHVSRQLAPLRDAGIVDFRSIGAKHLYYLTPAARDTYAAMAPAAVREPSRFLSHAKIMLRAFGKAETRRFSGVQNFGGA